MQDKKTLFAEVGLILGSGNEGWIVYDLQDYVYSFFDWVINESMNKFSTSVETRIPLFGLVGCNI